MSSVSLKDLKKVESTMKKTEPELAPLGDAGGLLLSVVDEWLDSTGDEFVTDADDLTGDGLATSLSDAARDSDANDLAGDGFVTCLGDAPRDRRLSDDQNWNILRLTIVVVIQVFLLGGHQAIKT